MYVLETRLLFKHCQFAILNFFSVYSVRDCIYTTKQESCAIAKMSAQCALHMGALKIFGTYTPTATIPNIFMGFCFDRPYECSYKI